MDHIQHDRLEMLDKLEKLPLQRLKSNDSTTSSTFSRNSSSSSVATSLSIHNNTHSNNDKYFHHTTPSLSSLTEALQLSFGKTQLNNTSSLTTETNRDIAPTTTPTNESVVLQKWCIILVGLPASGKSSITNNLINFLKPFYHIDTFNAGSIRRKLSNFQTQDCNYFDFNNPEAKKQRDHFAQISLDHLLNSLFVDNLDIGILDATNSTKDRRTHIFDTINSKRLQNQHSNIKINTMVLEIKCEDQQCWNYNARMKTTNPDYKRMGYDKALRDFIERAKNYKQAFEEITQEEINQNKAVYVDFRDVGKDVEIKSEQVDQEEDDILKLVKKFLLGYYEEFGVDYLRLVKEA